MKHSSGVTFTEPAGNAPIGSDDKDGMGWYRAVVSPSPDGGTIAAKQHGGLGGGQPWLPVRGF